MDASHLVFIDETGLNTKMAALRGWAHSGMACIAKTPHGHWKSSTFIAAPRSDGAQAPWILDGPMDGKSFPAYLRAQLVCLAPYSPDLNPIEKAFSKLKADLRSRAARSFEELLDATAKALEGFMRQLLQKLQLCDMIYESCSSPF